MGRNQHVEPHERGWAVRPEGGSRPAKIFGKQTEAVAFAKDRAMSQASDLVVHKKDGSVARTTSFAPRQSAPPRTKDAAQPPAKSAANRRAAGKGSAAKSAASASQTSANQLGSTRRSSR